MSSSEASHSRAHPDACVHVAPRQVVGDRLEQPGELLIERVFFAQQDPVPAPQRHRHRVWIDVAAEHGDEQLLQLGRAPHLLLADLRLDELPAEDADDRLRRAEPSRDSRLPVRRGGNVLAVEPDLVARRDERRHEPTPHELAVTARVRDKGVRTVRTQIHFRRRAGDRLRGHLSIEGLGESNAAPVPSRVPRVFRKSHTTGRPSASRPST